jgi:hypothetical protein
MPRLLIHLLRRLQCLLKALKPRATLLRFVLALWQLLKRIMARGKFLLERGARPRQLERSVPEAEASKRLSEKEAQQNSVRRLATGGQSDALLSELGQETQAVFQPLVSNGETISLVDVAASREPEHHKLGDFLSATFTTMGLSHSHSSSTPNLPLFSRPNASSQHLSNRHSEHFHLRHPHHLSSPNLHIHTPRTVTSENRSRPASRYSYRPASAHGSAVSLHVRILF